MRYLFAFAAVATAAQLAAHAASAQYGPPPEGAPVYQPADYNSLLSRIEQLEANQGVGPCSPYQTGFYGRYDSVIVKPILSHNQAFNAQLDGDADTTVRSVGFNLDLEYSPRVEVGYLAPTSELGWRARYWHFDADSSVGPIEGDGTLINDDAIAINVGGQIEDVDAITEITYDLELNVFDVEATKTTNVGLFSGGARIADLKQRYSAQTDDGNLVTNLEQTAVGPTVAYELRSGTPMQGLIWFGIARASLLYGEKTLDSDTNDQEMDYNYDEPSFISNLEMQLGVEYWRESGWFIRLAAEAQYWGNVGNATDHFLGTNDGSGQSASSILQDDLGFIGLNIGLGKVW